jgi:hypothetical protein
MVEENKTLIIERYPYGIRFFIDGSNKSYFIKEDENHGWLVIIEEEERQMIDIYEDLEEGFGVRSLDELVKAFKDSPEEYYEMVTGEKHRIGKVVIEDIGVS